MWEKGQTRRFGRQGWKQGGKGIDIVSVKEEREGGGVIRKEGMSFCDRYDGWSGK